MKLLGAVCCLRTVEGGAKPALNGKRPAALRVWPLEEGLGLFEDGYFFFCLAAAVDRCKSSRDFIFVEGENRSC